jgi:hypothetical protein
MTSCSKYVHGNFLQTNRADALAPISFFICQSAPMCFKWFLLCAFPDIILLAHIAAYDLCGSFKGTHENVRISNV